jgi:FkbM family methyltransferase
MAPNVSVIETKSGKYMVWSTYDALTEILLKDGVHEESVIQLSNFILQNCPGEQVVLDIGANIGSYAIPLAKEPGNAGRLKVYCFEVQRQVFLQLCGNIFLNRLDNIHTYNFGVGEKAAQIKIPKIDYATCWNMGGYSIDPVALNANRTDFPKHSIIGEETCEVRPIDDLPGLPLSNLVKLDVEGHELEVLKGMQKHLEASGYPPIIFEVWKFDWYAEKKDLLFKYLHDTGYTNISMDIGYSNHLAQHERSTAQRINFTPVGGVIQLSK